MDQKPSFRLTSYGAAGEVTGSKHLIETPRGSRILLDCGMFQGKREEAMEKNCCFGFPPDQIDAVLVSHAHIDHSGLLPKLHKEGFMGTIFATVGTLELSYLMLLDSARIQQEDEQFVARHHMKNPFEKKAPLYNLEDVEKTMKLFVGKNYGEPFQVTEDVTAEFLDAGHVFGSSIILLTIETDQGKKKIVFTGDLGRSGMPIIQDPEFVNGADYLIIESTYGDRKHERVQEIEQDLADVINRTAKRGGKVFIPAFALERTQEIILRLENLIHHGKIPNLKIYVDSPLADRITKVFEDHPEYYDEELQERHEKKRKIFSFPNLTFTQSVEESKGLNHLNVPSIIISGSGMAESGRIRHHLKNNIEDPKNSVMIVGYQAEETLGRKLVEGQKTVTIFGNDYAVRSEIVVFKSLSAHADQDGLDEYVKSIKGLKKIFLVHGEEESRQAFAERIKLFYPSAEVILPEPEQAYSLEPAPKKVPQPA